MLVEQGSTLLMGFQDVAFLPSRSSLLTTFLKNCGIGECLRTTTCLITVVEMNASGPPHVLRLWLR